MGGLGGRVGAVPAGTSVVELEAGGQCNAGCSKAGLAAAMSSEKVRPVLAMLAFASGDNSRRTPREIRLCRKAGAGAPAWLLLKLSANELFSSGSLTGEGGTAGKLRDAYTGSSGIAPLLDSTSA